MRIGQKPRRHIELDEIDRRIISLLQQDGRRTHADMARFVGTSTQTIRNRLDRLVDGGVIDVMAIVNPASIGFGKDALIVLRVRQGRLRSVGDQLTALEHVSYVGFMSGEFDIMIEVYVRDDEHLFRFLTEDLARISDIESAHVWTVLHTQKYNYAWANPFESSLTGSPDGRWSTEGGSA